MNAGETTCVKTRCVAACPISSSASQRGVVLTLHPDGTAASNSLEIIVHKALGRQESTILRSIVQQAVQIPRESLFRPPLFNFCSFSVTFFYHTSFLWAWSFFSRNNRQLFHKSGFLPSFCVGTADRLFMLRWCNKHFLPIPDVHSQTCRQKLSSWDTPNGYCVMQESRHSQVSCMSISFDFWLTKF